MQTIRISTEAAQELEEAVAWYEKEQKGLGARLIDAFEHALQLLREPSPPLTPYNDEIEGRKIKKLILHKFPFSVIIADIHDSMVIVALAHHSRKPGYWDERIRQ